MLVVRAFLPALPAAAHGRASSRTHRKRDRVAIAAKWVVTGAAVNQTAAQIYTVPSTGYNRDLVVANAGTVSIYAGLSTDGTVATSAAAFKIPAGGSIILTQCQVPTGAVLSVIAGTGNGLASVGYGSLVSYT